MNNHGIYVIARSKCPGQLRRNNVGEIITFWTEIAAEAKRITLPDPKNWFVRKLASNEYGGSRSYRKKVSHD